MRLPFAATSRPSRRGRPLSASVLASVLFTLTLVIAACGDTGELGSSKLKSVGAGATREQVLAAIGRGQLTAEGIDTMRVVNGFRLEEFFQDGTTYSVIWYREQPGTIADTVRRTTDTPIVFAGDSMTGWGWDFYMQWASEKGIPKPPL
jgi:stage V sporulation protein SpoVS